MKSEIEVVVSFDTTGSMFPCLSQVRRELTQFITTLFNEIPNLRIGIIAHGDYFDASMRGSYVIKDHELTIDKNALIKFVNSCGNTNGGDAAECYELVLHQARAFKWTAGKSKVLILIGDDIPHGANEKQNTEKLDWRNELKCLLEMGVKVYGVQALNRSHATSFYNEIARVTGGFHLSLDQFSDVTNLIRAICYQQSGTDQLMNFEKAVKDNGQMTRSMKKNFGTLLGRTAAELTAEMKKMYGSSGLNAVSPGRFQVLNVDDDCRIDEFVRDNGLIFQKGKGFYEFTKPVKIQSYKEIVLMDKVTGDMFTGEKARDIMDIPVGVDAKVRPDKYEDKYVAFIQSTSLNRKLLSGTRFLYEVDLTR